MMDKEEDLKKELKNLEERLKDREDALPAHSVKPNQMLIIDELETAIEEKKKELAELKKGKPISRNGLGARPQQPEWSVGFWIMRTYLDCFPCFLNQALRAARIATPASNY